MGERACRQAVGRAATGVEGTMTHHDGPDPGLGKYPGQPHHHSLESEAGGGVEVGTAGGAAQCGCWCWEEEKYLQPCSSLSACTGRVSARQQRHKQQRLPALAVAAAAPSQHPTPPHPAPPTSSACTTLGGRPRRGSCRQRHPPCCGIQGGGMQGASASGGGAPQLHSGEEQRRWPGPNKRPLQQNDQAKAAATTPEAPLTSWCR